MFRKSFVTLFTAAVISGSAAAASATVAFQDRGLQNAGFQLANRSAVCNEAAQPERLAELRAYRDALRQDRRAQSEDLALRVADINRPGVAHRLSLSDRLAYMRNRDGAMRGAAGSRKELRRLTREIKFVSRALRDPVSTCD